MTRFAAAAAAALALLSTAGVASAQDYRVTFGDLDMASPTDAARFDRRLNRAARNACDGGSPIATAVCMARFKAEVMDQLPQSRRDDYARARPARVARVLAMVPTVYG